MNPAPDGERASVGEENFHWFVETVASYAIELALKGRATPDEYRWSSFLRGAESPSITSQGGNGSTVQADAKPQVKKGSKSK
jgi:hypothetical protein